MGMYLTVGGEQPRDDDSGKVNRIKARIPMCGGLGDTTTTQAENVAGERYTHTHKEEVLGCRSRAVATAVGPCLGKACRQGRGGVGWVKDRNKVIRSSRQACIEPQARQDPQGPIDALTPLSSNPCRRSHVTSGNLDFFVPTAVRHSSEG